MTTVDYGKQIKWVKLLSWYAGCLAICSVGTFLSYSGPFSSEAWRAWSSAHAWQRDVLRALAASIVAIFLIWSMRIIPLHGSSKDERVGSFRLSFIEWSLLIFFLCLLIYLAFCVLPEIFRLGLEGRPHPISFPPEQYKLPYRPFLLYMIGLWLGIVFPVLVFVIRSIVHDWRIWKDARKTLHATFPGEAMWSIAEIPKAFDQLSFAHQNYAACLKSIGERYIPVILGVSLVLLYEQLTPSHHSVTPYAVEVGKVALWLLLGPALVMFVTIVAIGYQNAANKTNTAFQKSLEVLLKSQDREEFSEKVLKARAELMWNQTPVTFVLSVVKSASVSIPLMLALSGYLLEKLLRPEGWLSIFVPNAIIESFKRIYTD